MLRLLGKLYGLVVDLRNALFYRGWIKSFSLGAKTISIGNITAGGTGKTPLVAYVAEILADAGEKVCILTRGYGRESSGRVLVSDWERVLVDARAGGDEPVELARKLIGKAIVVADADRVSAAAYVKEKFGITAFVLDDGFQHRRAKRDLDIVCIDATNPFGSGGMLPAGRLREPLENLSRADAIVLTRTDLADNVSDVISRIAELSPTAKVFRSKSKAGAPIYLSKFLAADNGSPFDPNVPLLAFCGLGNPDAFFESVLRGGYAVQHTEEFADHHYYTQDDIDGLEKLARQHDAGVLLTTAKDAVKLRALNFSIPCFVMKIQIEMDAAEAFRRLITSS